jgi:hypothetical protein
MLATLDDAMAGIMTFASLTDAVALTVEQCGALNIVRLLLQRFL